MLKTFLIYTTAIIGALLFVPGIPPDDVFDGIEPNSLKITDFELGLDQNNIFNLEDAKIFPTEEVDKTTLPFIKGPESFAVKEGFLYTGIYGGDIIRTDLKKKNFKNPKWEFVYHHSPNPEKCLKQSDEDICGRPLGLAFDAEGRLLVADSTAGLYKVNVEKKTGETLSKQHFANSVVTSTKKAGSPIYFTVSATNFNLADGILTLLGNGTGLLIEFDPKTKKSEILDTGLKFGNGISLSKNEEFLIYNDGLRGIVWKYHLQGSKKGSKEIFLRLPGATDNIARSPKGFIIGVISYMPPEEVHPLGDIVLPNKYLCKLLSRIGYNFKYGLKFISKLMGGAVPMLDELAFWSCHFETIGKVSPMTSMLVEVDESGKILRAWRGSEKNPKVHGICEGLVVDDKMFLGTPFNDYIGYLPY